MPPSYRYRLVSGLFSNNWIITQSTTEQSEQSHSHQLNNHTELKILNNHTGYTWTFGTITQSTTEQSHRLELKILNNHTGYTWTFGTITQSTNEKSQQSLDNTVPFNHAHLIIGDPQLKVFHKIAMGPQTLHSLIL